MQLIKPDDLATHFERKARQLGSCGQLAEANGYATAAVVLRFAPFLPTIEAEPVRRSMWVRPCVNKYGHPCHHCFTCGFKASQKDRNYCPNCGAKMGAKEESHE